MIGRDHQGRDNRTASKGRATDQDGSTDVAAADPGRDRARVLPYEVVDLPSLEPVDCPCGQARRAFADRVDFPGTLHLTEISADARTHYHLEHTETYLILECEPNAALEIDGERIAVRPLTAVLIPPGTRHRAIGEMKVAIICTPNFDPTDEHF